MNFMEGEVARREATFKPYCIDQSGRRMEVGNGSEYPTGVVSIIPYKDVIIKEGDGCGNLGTENFARLIREAAADPNVAAIILDIDSPGGSANATENPTAAINQARESKPVLLYAGNGMVASAAYWIGSAADEIYASFPSDQIGSIGTYITLADFSERYKAMGIKVESIYASKSTAKNGGYRRWKEDGKSDVLIKNDLDPFNDVFIQAVKNARGEKINEDVFDGRLLMANDALSFGLIDGIQSFDATIERAFELASLPRQQKTQQAMFGKKYPQLTALINTKSEERNDDQLTAANQELKEAGLDNVTLVSLEEMNQGSAALTKEKDAHKATGSQLIAATSTISAIAEAFGLTEKDGKFTNAEGEEVSIVDAAKAVVSQRDEYGKKSGDIATADTEKKSEIEAPVQDATADFYNSIDQKINQ